MKNSKKDSKQMLFEMMHKVGGMGLNEESYVQDPWVDPRTPYLEFKNKIKKYVDNNDFDSFHYLIGHQLDDNLFVKFFFDFDADYGLSKHLFNELIKIKNSGFWSNHI